MRQDIADILTALTIFCLFAVALPRTCPAQDLDALRPDLLRRWSGLSSVGSPPPRFIMELKRADIDAAGTLHGTGRCSIILTRGYEDFPCELRLNRRGLQTEITRIDPPSLFGEIILTGHLRTAPLRLDLRDPDGDRLVLYPE